MYRNTAKHNAGSAHRAMQNECCRQLRTIVREIMEMGFYENIAALAAYGIERKLIGSEDRIWCINRLLEMFKEDEYIEPENVPVITICPEEAGKDGRVELFTVLDALTDEAVRRGIVESDDIVSRDLFDTKIMGVLPPSPSQAIREFRENYEKSPQEATEKFYAFSQDTNYIRRDRIRKDMRWKTDSPYGQMDVTINLSKPEKDPKAIAAALSAKQSAYPKCQLCIENEGYAGRMNHPARQNHRIIPICLAGDDWGFQYSPYVYYNEHCIVLNRAHVPMQITRGTFERLTSFTEMFPHYFLGSNADLPIVGGSILTHDHFQGGHYEFAMAKAGIEQSFVIRGFEDVKAGIVHWPMSVIRLQSSDRERIVELSDYILRKWRAYTDEAAFIFAETDGVPHNTITPIARRRGDLFEMDLVLRNNITTEEFPLGVYHPHQELHHIKKENIGLIEVMGLAVLPSRLKKEMEELAACIREGKDPAQVPELEKHAAWTQEILTRRPQLAQMDVEAVLREEIGKVFVRVLEDAGVYKCTQEGRAAFGRFTASLNQ